MSCMGRHMPCLRRPPGLHCGCTASTVMPYQYVAVCLVVHTSGLMNSSVHRAAELWQGQLRAPCRPEDRRLQAALGRFLGCSHHPGPDTPLPCSAGVAQHCSNVSDPVQQARLDAIHRHVGNPGSWGAPCLACPSSVAAAWCAVYMSLISAFACAFRTRPWRQHCP